MKFTVEYPVRDADATLGEGMNRIARLADESGFDAIAFTEHPAPSKKWLDAGGHLTLDASAALSYCAAVTERIRLMPFVMVLPYHNPFVAAKALTTIDRLSGGRVTVVAGGGYLRSEFLALGVDFERRNEIFDESIEVMRGVWTGEPLDHDGAHFQARGVVSVPSPLQPGGPPILIGGNGRLARRRAARNQGWSPMLVSEQVARTAKNPAITSIEELAPLIAEVRALADELGNDGNALHVQASTPHGSSWASYSPDEHRDHLQQLEQAGVSSFVVHLAGNDLAALEDSLQAYAAEFIRPTSSSSAS